MTGMWRGLKSTFEFFKEISKWLLPRDFDADTVWKMKINTPNQLTATEIHLCQFLLGEVHQRIAMLLGILPDHQKTPFCHLRSGMFHGLCLQLPARNEQ